MASLTKLSGENPSARHRLVRRVGWGVADQALSSLTNVALGIVVARSVTAREFGAFSLAYTTYLIAVGTSRALNSEPLIVRFSAVPEERWRLGASMATGAAVVLGLLGGAVSVALSLVFGDAAHTGVFLVLAIFLPVVLLQDGWRMAFVARGWSSRAFLTDLTWAVALVPALALVLFRPDPTALNLLTAWGASGTLAAVVALAIGRAAPGIHRTFSWWWEQRDMGFRYLAEYVASNGAFQLNMFTVAAVAGLASAGSLRGAFLLLGPAVLLIQGSRLVFVPEGIRLLRRSPSLLRRAVFLLSGVIVFGSLAWGAIVFVLPDGLGRALLGASWDGAHALIVPMTLLVAASGAEMATVVGLRSLANPRLSFKARMIEGAMTLAGGTLGAILGGAKGLAWALAVAFWLEVGVWWWQFLKGLEAYRPDPEGAPDVPDDRLAFQVGP